MSNKQTNDPSYAAAWKLESKGKLVRYIVDHVPKEISRAASFFLERWGKINGKAFEEIYKLSPILKGGLEIMVSVKLRIADER